MTEIQPDPYLLPPRFTQHRFRAYVVKAAVTGGGDSREEALAELERNFESVRQRILGEGKELTRPGVNWPVEFAAQDRVLENEELSQDFIRRVLDLEWAWISDESSIWDFHADQTNDALCTKISEIYGVDVSDIESGRLWEIFRRIEGHRSGERTEQPT